MKIARYFSKTEENRTDEGRGRGVFLLPFFPLFLFLAVVIVVLLLSAGDIVKASGYWHLFRHFSHDNEGRMGKVARLRLSAAEIYENDGTQVVSWARAPKGEFHYVGQNYFSRIRFFFFSSLFFSRWLFFGTERNGKNDAHQRPPDMMGWRVEAEEEEEGGGKKQKKEMGGEGGQREMVSCVYICVCVCLGVWYK